MRKLGRTDDTPGVQYCEAIESQKTSVACYNGGTCRTENGEQRGSNTGPCECPEGTGGVHCELSCMLQCENGGQCQFEQEEDESFLPPWGQSEDGMFCRCRQGYVGLHCKQEAESCGPDGLICLTGSTCVQDSHSKVYRCIQPKVNRCNPSSPHPEFYEGMAVVAFCLNEGTCREVMIGNDLYVYIDKQSVISIGFTCYYNTSNFWDDFSSFSCFEILLNVYTGIPIANVLLDWQVHTASMLSK